MNELTEREKVRAEEKLLIAVCAQEVFCGTLVRQEKPRCCGRLIDLYRAPRMHCRDVSFGKRTVTLLEPVCPDCGRRVKATFSIIH
jgi:hypothetical protein